MFIVFPPSGSAYILVTAIGLRGPITSNFDEVLTCGGVRGLNRSESPIFIMTRGSLQGSERFFLDLTFFTIGAMSSCSSPRKKRGFKRGRLFRDPERSKKSVPCAFSPHRRLRW